MKKFLDHVTRFLGGDRTLGAIMKSSDILLAFVIISILMMLIFPVPPHVIDILISINLFLQMFLLRTEEYALDLEEVCLP